MTRLIAAARRVPWRWIAEDVAALIGLVGLLGFFSLALWVYQ